LITAIPAASPAGWCSNNSIGFAAKRAQLARVSGQRRNTWGSMSAILFTFPGACKTKSSLAGAILGSGTRPARIADAVSNVLTNHRAKTNSRQLERPAMIDDGSLLPARCANQPVERRRVPVAATMTIR
jgi:hypothetical protein